MTTVTEETSETLAGFLAGLNELRAEYPQLAGPVRSCTCRSDDYAPCVAIAAAFPPGWTDRELGLIAADALTHEQAHWEIVNGTPPPVHSMLPEAPGPPVLYAVRDDALEPLPAQSGHGWLDETLAAFAASDEKADAAVTRFEAVHDEQPSEDDGFGDDDREPDGENYPATFPADDEDEPDESDLDPVGEGRFFPFGGGDDAPDAA